MADDQEPVELPVEMYEGDEATLAPVFAGERMEAEIVRSLLEANDIPAVVFGRGYYELEGATGGDRVMVRADHVEAALQVLGSSELRGGEVVSPDSDDIAVMVDESYPEEDADEAWDLPDEEWTPPEQVDVLATRSDGGPRVAALLGLLVLGIVIAVVLLQAD